MDISERNQFGKLLFLLGDAVRYPGVVSGTRVLPRRPLDDLGETRLYFPQPNGGLHHVVVLLR